MTVFAINTMAVGLNVFFWSNGNRSAYHVFFMGFHAGLALLGLADAVLQ